MYTFIVTTLLHSTVASSSYHTDSAPHGQCLGPFDLVPQELGIVYDDLVGEPKHGVKVDLYNRELRMMTFSQNERLGYWNPFSLVKLGGVHPSGTPIDHHVTTRVRRAVGYDFLADELQTPLRRHALYLNLTQQYVGSYDTFEAWVVYVGKVQDIALLVPMPTWNITYVDQSRRRVSEQLRQKIRENCAAFYFNSESSANRFSDAVREFVATTPGAIQEQSDLVDLVASKTMMPRSTCERILTGLLSQESRPL